MRKAAHLGPSTDHPVRAATLTIARRSANGLPRPPFRADTFSDLRDLCDLRNAGTVNPAEFQLRNAELLQQHNCRLSTRSPLLISGSDRYAEERAASW